MYEIMSCYVGDIKQFKHFNLGGGGLDSSYHVRTNMRLRMGNIGGVSYTLYIRERYTFSIVCPFKKDVIF